MYTPLDEDGEEQSSFDNEKLDDAMTNVLETEEDDEDLYELYRKEEIRLRSAAARREFFSGIKF